MLVNKIICPKCGSSLTSKAGVPVGAAIACPKCKERLKVAAPPEEPEEDFEFVDEVDEEEAPPPRKPAPKPAVKRRPVEDDEDEEEERPKPKKRPPAADEDDEDERPRAKRRSRDDDEDDDRPRKRKKRKKELSAYGKLKSNIWVRVSVLGVLLIILGFVIYIKLIKEGGTDSTTTGQASEQANADQARLQGTWRATSAKTNGKSFPPQAVSQMSFTFSGNRATFSQKPNESAKVTLDPSQSPAAMDFTETAASAERGIYRFVDNDTLEICFTTDPNAPRPRTFTSLGADSMVHMVLTRNK